MVAEYAGDDAEARRVLASILDDQFLLARAVVDLERADLDARQEPGPRRRDTSAQQPRLAPATTGHRPVAGSGRQRIWAILRLCVLCSVGS